MENSIKTLVLMQCLLWKFSFSDIKHKPSYCLSLVLCVFCPVQKSGWNYMSAFAVKIWADFWNNPGATNQEQSFPIPGKVLMESLYQLPPWRVSQEILQKYICTITMISKSKLLHLPLAASQPGAADKNSFLWCCWPLSSQICTTWTGWFEPPSTFWIKNCNFP